MKKRQIICGLILFGVIMGCDNEASTIALAEDTDVITMQEYNRAVNNGFLPEGMKESDIDKTVTWKQYCEILENMIRLEDDDAVQDWKTMTADAPETEMKRDGAMIALLFAGQILGIDERNINTEFLYDEYNWGEHVSWDYPVFPWDEGYPSDDELMNDPDNAVGPAYVYSVCRVSLISEKPLLDSDYGNGDLHLEESLILQDAMISAIRLYESIEHEENNYISVSDVATYDKTIITDELLNAPSELPEVTQNELCAQWKGAGISARKDGKHLQQHFKEADIKFLAENGFNFTRIFLGFSTLRYPDFLSDIKQVNETELRELDQLIAWGIEYGVHIQISMSDTPDNMESFDLSEEEWENIHDYWKMLAYRYAEIPSRYVTFDLANEFQPSEENMEYATENIRKIVTDIRETDSDRVLLISFGDNPTEEWVRNMAETGIALGCHPYSPKYLNDGSEEFTDAEACWPYPFLPARLENGESIKISGNLGGKILKIDFWVYRPFTVTCNTGEVLNVDVQGDYIDEMSCDWRFFEPYRIEIPEGVTQLEITSEEDCTIHEILMECNGESKGLVPVDTMANRSHGSSALIWSEDGWTSEKNYTPDMIYDEMIKPIRDIAEENAVGFMCNEFGIYACNVGWDISLIESYTNDILAMLENKNISWCFCEAEGWPYRFLTVPDKRHYEWENATLKSETYDFGDGTGRTFQYCEELMEIFRKYTVS